MQPTEHLKKLELLAPARDLECGIAAINHGADAVYIGAPKFGARVAAGNSLNDIGKLIDYAHRYWAKVYITINTILYDHELEEALGIARSVYDAGADALIIQDMGLLELGLPPIPLFASTQTHNYSLEKIQFLEKVGFQRIILARELSLKQLYEIRKSTSVDLEFFIHGALCVSFSGQCYLSEATQGRSANRGECAQPCRLPYTLTDSKGRILDEEKYLLSLKDLNLSGFLKNLIDAGITSFKIEGRLKDINYVKNITSYYRQRIDDIIEKGSLFGKASSGKTTIRFKPDPARTFNRGFTEYFIRRRSKDILSPHTPKSIGTYLGNVERIEKDHFVFDTEEELHSGDGICFLDRNKVLQGTNVTRIEGKKVYPSELDGIEEQAEIYRNFDYTFTKTLKSERTERLIGLEMRFEETEDGFLLCLKDENAVGTTVTRRMEKTSAINTRWGEETVRRQLTRLGGTKFVCKKFTLVWNQPYFLPISLLNELRREAVFQLGRERLQQYPRRRFHLMPNTEPYPETKLDYSANIANKKAEDFYRRHGVTSLDPAFELQSNVPGAALMTMKHCLRFQYGLCAGVGARDVEPLFLQEAKNRYRLEFDCDVCQMKIISE